MAPGMGFGVAAAAAAAKLFSPPQLGARATVGGRSKDRVGATMSSSYSSSCGDSPEVGSGGAAASFAYVADLEPSLTVRARGRAWRRA